MRKRPRGDPSHSYLTNEEKFERGFVDVEVPPLCARPQCLGGGALREYGISLAVQLYMTFQLECGLVFLLISILSAGNITDNIDRNELRNVCRRLLATQYECLTGLFAGSSAANGTAGEPSSGSGFEDSSGLVSSPGAPLVSAGCPSSLCGYTGLPVRRDAIEITSYLKVALGTCEEYDARYSTLQPVESSQAGLLTTSGAAYCATESEDRRHRATRAARCRTVA